MSLFSNNDSLIRKIQEDISLENMLNIVANLSRYHRFSGSKDAEDAAGYIISELVKYGIGHERLCYEAVFSHPRESKIKIINTGEVIPAMPCVYSGPAENMEGELYFDCMSTEKNLSENQNIERFAAFDGKIILTKSPDVAFARKASRAGALGIIYMWPTGEDYLHHFLLGADIWGTPTPDTIHELAFLPSLTIKKKDGEKLLALCQKGKTALSVNADVTNTVQSSSMPMAIIPGKTEKYVLVSGHYDSWYEGATDNATANAIMLELARQFKMHQHELFRGVKIVWWSGHSDARYSGSTWFCDNYREELKRNCIAHINLDMCGAKNSDVMIPRTTLMEGMDLSSNIIEELTGRRPPNYIPMCRAADQSFYGADIPLPVTVKIEPLPENIYFSNPGGGPWWHSYYDTLDKVDPPTLYRDAKYHAKIVLLIANSMHLPVQMSNFVGLMEGFLKGINTDTCDEFDFAPIFGQLDALKAPLRRLEEEIPRHPAGETDDIIHKVAGRLIRMTYSSCGAYEYDPVDYHPGAGSEGFVFFRIRRATKVTRENCPPDRFLFIKTDFVRQKNRLVGELQDLISCIEAQLNKWYAE